MRVHTRPFVTPLVADVPDKAVEYGTGSYVEDSRVRLLTCAHVLKHGSVQHQFSGEERLFPDPGGWALDRGKDVAATDMPTTLWVGGKADAESVPNGRFAPRHAPVDMELLFFGGWRERTPGWRSACSTGR